MTRLMLVAVVVALTAGCWNSDDDLSTDPDVAAWEGQYRAREYDAPMEMAYPARIEVVLLTWDERQPVCGSECVGYVAGVQNDGSTVWRSWIVANYDEHLDLWDDGRVVGEPGSWFWGEIPTPTGVVTLNAEWEDALP